MPVGLVFAEIALFVQSFGFDAVFKVSAVGAVYCSVAASACYFSAVSRAVGSGSLAFAHFRIRIVACFVALYCSVAARTGNSPAVG